MFAPVHVPSGFCEFGVSTASARPAGYALGWLSVTLGHVDLLVGQQCCVAFLITAAIMYCNSFFHDEWQVGKGYADTKREISVVLINRIELR